MDAIAFSSGFRFSSLSTDGKLKFREVADGPSWLSFKKDFTRTLSIKPKGKSTGKSKNDEVEISQPSDDAKSGNQEEIIALFRRIQSSISKGDPISTPLKRRNASLPSRDKYKPSNESVLEILRQSRKQVKGESSSKRGVSEELSQKEILLKEEMEQEYQPITDFKISRPPSKFVKKSPIPSLSISREVVVEQANMKIGADAESESKRIKEMKVSELKELAKSGGIKGYSKLKKKELIQLLRSSI